MYFFTFKWIWSDKYVNINIQIIAENFLNLIICLKKMTHSFLPYYNEI